jgi:hypothetical protein
MERIFLGFFLFDKTAQSRRKGPEIQFPSSKSKHDNVKDQLIAMGLWKVLSAWAVLWRGGISILMRALILD